MMNTTNLRPQKLNQSPPLILFICLIYFFIFDHNYVFGQKSSNTGGASISATITTPLGITKTNDINIRSSTLSTSKNITIDPYKIIEIRNSGSSINSKGIVKPASFNITGEDRFIYSITLPTSVYASLNTSDSRTVLIKDFTSLPTGKGILTTGAQTIFIGATINFNASLPINKKKDNGDFEIIINYN